MVPSAASKVISEGDLLQQPFSVGGWGPSPWAMGAPPRFAGAEDLVVAPKRAKAHPDLERLSPSASTPVLLDLARAQAARRRPADLIGQLRSDAFVAPATMGQREAHALDGLALEAAEEYEAVLLSPVAPLGSCSVLAPTSQDRTLSAHRGTEVVSDPTNMLALIAARRLSEADRVVRLCTVHQVVRAQALPPIPGYSRHFRMLALGEAGRALPEERLEVEAMGRAAHTFEKLLDSVSRVSARASDRVAVIHALPSRRALGDRLEGHLAAVAPSFRLSRDEAVDRYYAGARVTLHATTPSGDALNIADIGTFDWVAKLTSNRSNRYVAAGFGLGLVPRFQP